MRFFDNENAAAMTMGERRAMNSAVELMLENDARFLELREQIMGAVLDAWQPGLTIAAVVARAKKIAVAPTLSQWNVEARGGVFDVTEGNAWRFTRTTLVDAIRDAVDLGAPYVVVISEDAANVTEHQRAQFHKGEKLALGLDARRPVVTVLE